MIVIMIAIRDKHYHSLRSLHDSSTATTSPLLLVECTIPGFHPSLISLTLSNRAFVTFLKTAIDMAEIRFLLDNECLKAVNAQKEEDSFLVLCSGSVQQGRCEGIVPTNPVSGELPCCYTRYRRPGIRACAVHGSGSASSVGRLS